MANHWKQRSKTRADELKEYNTAQEVYERKRRMPPEVSDNMVKQVSLERRAAMEEETNAGQFREKGSMPDVIVGKYNTITGKFQPTGVDHNNSSPDFSEPTQAGLITKSSSNVKIASSYGAGSGGGQGSWRGPNDASHMMPEAYSPLWMFSNLSLPRDRVSINTWSRAFFALNPIVQNAISLHSTYPISKLNIKSKNKRVEKFFADMIEEIDLMNVCVQIAQEYWTLGEAFIYAELDQQKGKWKRLLIQNPDYISVSRSVMAGEPIISLRPDESLKRLVTSANPSDVQQRRQLPPDIIDYVRKGKNIPLNNFNISHLARRIAPYETRGTGLIVSSFKQLMLFDRLRESKYTQADEMITPTTLVKVGNSEFRPTSADLEGYRHIFEEAKGDKNATIFCHDAVTVERVGYGQGIFDISGDIQQVIKEIYIGLMVPSVLMDGTDTTYANGSVALDVLRQRYMQFRNMLSSWLRRKIFAPISHINNFYEFVDGEKRLIVPEIDWNHMSLFDMSDNINTLMSLAQKQQGESGTNLVSLQALYRSLGLEYEDEIRKIRYEDIQETIRKKELQALDRYTLSELRALTPEDEITEAIEPPVLGESPYVDNAVPDEGGGMPGMGGMPMGKPPMPGMSGASRPRPPMGAGGSPPKGPGGAPKRPGAPPSGGSPKGPTGGGSPPGQPPRPA